MNPKAARKAEKKRKKLAQQNSRVPMRAPSLPPRETPK